ncbi:MAG: ROK family protein [Kiritimatiellaeota bacterium]|nr:ROK family protein [Kiritimatiellota bacterium]
MGNVLLGWDIGGTKCAAVLGTGSIQEGVRVLRRDVFPTAETVTPEATMERLAQLNEAALAARGLDTGRVSRLGVSCGGPLNSRTGRVLGPPNLPGWDDVPLTTWAEKRLGIPAAIQNDANACALAEFWWGAGKGCESIIFLTAGTGMGAGLVLDGRLYAGRSDLAGEVGHIRLADDGPWGFGKNGSFEGFCSGGGIGRLSEMRTGVKRTAREVFEDAAKGDAGARAVVEESSRRLGQALSIFIDVLNPDRIVLGSIFVRQRDVIWPIAREVITREALPDAVACCEVVSAQLGEALGDLAAMGVALYEPS